MGLLASETTLVQGRVGSGRRPDGKGDGQFLKLKGDGQCPGLAAVHPAPSATHRTAHLTEPSQSPVLWTLLSPVSVKETDTRRHEVSAPGLLVGRCRDAEPGLHDS